MYMKNFQDLFLQEFANKDYDIKTGDKVDFIYAGETVKAIVVEIQDGKDAKAVIQVTDPKKYSNHLKFRRTLSISVKLLRKSLKQKLQDIGKDLVYV